MRAENERLRNKENVTNEDLTRIIDEYDELKIEVNKNIDLRWEKICKAAKAENIQRLVDVITRTIKRKSDSGNSAKNRLEGSFKEGKDIKIGTDPKDGKDPIKKVDEERLEAINRSQGTKYVQIDNVKLLFDE